jgi:hypothetical protein
MTTKEETEMQNRLEEVYNRLVSETDNKETTHNERKNKALHLLLDVVEYIKDGGITGENPLDDIFA